MTHDFKFNDELLLDPADQEYARKELEDAYFVVFAPETHDAFRRIDRRALSERNRFRFFGLLAVFLAFAAICTAAYEAIILIPAYDAQVASERAAKGDPETATDGSVKALSPALKLEKQRLKTVAAGAASAGLVGVLISWLGMGIARRKQRWLAMRLFAERIRQWNWQYLLANLPAAVRSMGAEDRRNAYVEHRKRAFDNFARDFESKLDARLHENLGAEHHHADTDWLMPQMRPHVSPQKLKKDMLDAVDEDSDAHRRAEKILRAYNRTRMQGQLDYSQYMVGEGRFWTHPFTQLRILEGTGHFLIAATIVMHVAIVCAVLFDIPELKSPHVYFLTISFAIAALALRAVEGGLRAEQNLERLKTYREELQDLFHSFHTADLENRIDIAIDFEAAAGREMREFLHCTKEQKYLM